MKDSQFHSNISMSELILQKSTQLPLDEEKVQMNKFSTTPIPASLKLFSSILIDIIKDHIKKLFTEQQVFEANSTSNQNKGEDQTLSDDQEEIIPKKTCIFEVKKEKSRWKKSRQISRLYNGKPKKKKICAVKKAKPQKTVFNKTISTCAQQIYDTDTPPKLSMTPNELFLKRTRDKKLHKKYTRFHHLNFISRAHGKNTLKLRKLYPVGKAAIVTFTKTYLEQWRLNIQDYDMLINQIKNDCIANGVCQICDGKNAPLYNEELGKIHHQRSAILKRFNEKVFMFNCHKIIPQKTNIMTRILSKNIPSKLQNELLSLFQDSEDLVSAKYEDLDSFFGDMTVKVSDQNSLVAQDKVGQNMLFY